MSLGRGVGESESIGHDRPRSTSTLFLPGVLLLVSTKALDILTTVIGLQLVPRATERNVIAQQIMAEGGTVVGLVTLGAAVVFGSTIVIECGVLALYRFTEATRVPILLRGVGYGVPSFVYLFAIHANAQLIVESASVATLLASLG